MGGSAPLKLAKYFCSFVQIWPGLHYLKKLQRIESEGGFESILGLMSKYSQQILMLKIG